MRIGRNEDAMHLLERALELAPGFMPARYQLAVLLHRRNEPSQALAEVERLLAADPSNPGYRNLAAVILLARRRVRALEPPVCGAGEGLPGEPQGLAQLRPRAEDRGTTGRKRRRLPPFDHPGPRFRRGLLEPRQSQDIPLRHGRLRCHARRGRGSFRRRGESRPFLLRARQGPGGHRRLRGFLRALREGQCASPGAAPLRRRQEHRAHPAPAGGVLSRVLCRTRRQRQPGGKPDFHRRHAALRLDAAGADPVQPFGGRGHDRAARNDHAGPGTARARRFG